MFTQVPASRSTGAFRTYLGQMRKLFLDILAHARHAACCAYRRFIDMAVIYFLEYFTCASHPDLLLQQCVIVNQALSQNEAASRDICESRLVVRVPYLLGTEL